MTALALSEAQAEADARGAETSVVVVAALRVGSASAGREQPARTAHTLNSRTFDLRVGINLITTPYAARTIPRRMPS